jgi:S-adenosyl methyltransferase
VAPDTLVVYMDSDPVVYGHARGLLASGPQGNTAYLGSATCGTPGRCWPRRAGCWT